MGARLGAAAAEAAGWLSLVDSGVAVSTGAVEGATARAPSGFAVTGSRATAGASDVVESLVSAAVFFPVESTSAAASASFVEPIQWKAANSAPPSNTPPSASAAIIGAADFLGTVTSALVLAQFAAVSTDPTPATEPGAGARPASAPSTDVAPLRYPSSACIKTAALANRSSNSRAIARLTMATNLGSKSGTTSVSLGGSLSTILNISSLKVLPSKGTRPVTASYMMTPMAYTSLRGSTWLEPFACSGDM